VEPYLFSLPWVGFMAYALLKVRPARPLTEKAAGKESTAPSVTVFVPARNEAVNIQRCPRALAGSDYPDFEILILDDRS
jgi:chlorobactene glucosyltransferase